MTAPDRSALLAQLARATSAFSALLARAPLSAPVPACPGYDLAGLASHLGGVHLWATQALTSTEAPARPPAGPQERDALVDWYDGTARDLLAALRATDPATPCFTFGPPGTAGFWVRRQAHEATVHLWDAQAAVGEPEPLDPALSSDGVDEVLTVFLPRQVALGRTPRVEQPVALTATDTGAGWVVGDGEPTSHVQGPAASLLLLLWKRTSLEDRALQVDGDPSPTLALALTP